MTTSAPNKFKSGRDRLLGLATSETTIYILKRLLQAIPTVWIAFTLGFFIMQLAPGDVLSTLRENPKIPPDTVEQYRKLLGLDKSWLEQYFRLLWQIVTTGDFGPSFVFGLRPSTSLIWERIPPTLILAIASLITTWVLAIPLGVLGAVKQNRITDRILQVLSYVGQGFPSFIAALLLLIFAQNTSPWFPVGDMTSIDHADLNWFGKILDIAWHLILPTIALTLTGFAGLQRIMRGQLLDVLRQDYIQTARAKGLPEDRVIYKHALRNAINPLITLLGFEFAGLLSGAFITEYFFNWPGLGRLILQAVQAQDPYLVSASLVMGALMLIVGNLLADLLLKAADPRIKLEDMN
jgi:peptide/nickel transport system permease protein